MITQKHLDAMRDAMYDAEHILELIYVRTTTGKGPDVRDYIGQVASVIRDLKNARNGETR